MIDAARTQFESPPTAEEAWRVVNALSESVHVRLLRMTRARLRRAGGWCEAFAEDVLALSYLSLFEHVFRGRVIEKPIAFLRGIAKKKSGRVVRGDLDEVARLRRHAGPGYEEQEHGKPDPLPGGQRWRGSRIGRDSSDANENNGAETSVSEATDVAGLLRVVADAVATLPASLRAIVRLHYWEDWSQRAIAEHFKCSRRSVVSSLKVAHDALHAVLLEVKGRNLAAPPTRTITYFAYDASTKATTFFRHDQDTGRTTYYHYSGS